MTEEIKDQEVEKKEEQQEAAVEAAPVVDTKPADKTNSEDASDSSEGTSEAPRREHRGYQRQPRGGGKDDQGQKYPKFKRKVCKFCYDSKLEIDYKRSDILERFITDRGKILPRRVTGTCAKHQRQIAVEIKKARIIALLPFVEK